MSAPYQQQPVYGQPAYGQPAYGQPAYGQPAYGQPAYQTSPPPPQQGYQPYVPQQPVYAAAVAPDSLKQPLAPASSDGAARFQYGAGQWRDKFWLFLFVVHLAGMIGAASYLGPKFIKDQTGGNKANEIEPKHLIYIGIVAAVVGVVWAALWLNIMKRYAGAIIKISMFLTLLFLAGSAVVMVLLGAWWAAVVYGLIALITVIWYIVVRNRIPFAQAVLNAASTSIQENSGPIYVGYVVALLEILWMGFWSFTTAAVWYYYDTHRDAENKVKASGYAVYFVMLVSLYWTAQVLKNVAHVTTAGTVASWWLQPSITAPTWGSLRRACTTSLGSICFGSLLVAILKAIMAVLRGAQRSAQRSKNIAAICLLCIAQCILGCIERLLEYFNMYAYTQVAIYGKDFITAAKDTWELFKSRGLEILINDDLTGMVLTMGCFMGGAISAIVSAFWAHALGEAWKNVWPVIGMLGFVIGFVLVSLVMNVIESAVATTYVCWAEDPAALAEGRPEYFQALRNAALNLHPEHQW